MNLDKMYQMTILDYAKREDLKYEINDVSDIKRGHNPNCGDDITLFLKIKDSKIEDISYAGSACAICTASTSMLIELVKGKDLNEATDIVKEFFNMMRGNDANLEILKDAEVLSITKDQVARIKCSTLSWHTLKNILEDNGCEL